MLAIDVVKRRRVSLRAAVDHVHMSRLKEKGDTYELGPRLDLQP